MEKTIASLWHSKNYTLMVPAPDQLVCLPANMTSIHPQFQEIPKDVIPPGLEQRAATANQAAAMVFPEVAQRFDFKDTETELEKAPDAITIRSNSEDRAKAALTVLQDKLVKRKVSLRFTDPGKPEKTAKGGARIVVKIKEGIEVDKARAIVQTIKDSKLKVQASIQESQVRVSGKNKDDLQSVIAAVRAHDFGVELQFTNRRD